jgi:hypothetical protein
MLRADDKARTLQVAGFALVLLVTSRSERAMYCTLLLSNVPIQDVPVTMSCASTGGAAAQC